LVGKIEQRRDMPTRDDATLANLELRWVDHGYRMLALVDDLPSFFAARHAKVAWIPYGKFDHLPSLINPVCSIWLDAGIKPRREATPA